MSSVAWNSYRQVCTVFVHSVGGPMLRYDISLQPETTCEHSNTGTAGVTELMDAVCRHSVVGMSAFSGSSE